MNEDSTFISRRDFFSATLAKAIRNIPRVVPGGMSNILDLKKKPLSAEEAAFALAKTRRKSPARQLRTPDNSQDNGGIHSNSE